MWEEVDGQGIDEQGDRRVRPYEALLHFLAISQVEVEGQEDAEEYGFAMDFLIDILRRQPKEILINTILSLIDLAAGSGVSYEDMEYLGDDLQDTEDFFNGKW